MTHKKNNSNSGRMIVVWILIAGLLFYGISSSNLFSRYKNNANINNTASSYSCPMARNGGIGWGCGGNRNTASTTNTTTTTTTAPVNTAPVTTPTTTAYETVNVWHTAFALNPETVTLAAGKSYKLIITPTENGGWCMSTMTIPGIDDNVYPIKAGQPITISIDNAQAGNYEVICWAMGMHQGYIVIQ